MVTFFVCFAKMLFSHGGEMSEQKNAFGPTEALIYVFTELKDPRLDRCKKHKLIDIVVISVCAIVCGGRTWEDIEYFAQAREGWLRTFLDLPNGIPSHDTLNRVFSLIDTDAFSKCFSQWVAMISDSLEGKIIGIDGKSLRGAIDSASSPVHLVNAFCLDNKTILAQCAVEDKSNEITAMPKILAMLSIKGSTITADAMHTQRDTAELILAKGADYVMALKGNQGNLNSDVALSFDGASPEVLDLRLGKRLTTVDNDHGRLEERSYWLTTDIDELVGHHKWPGLKAIGITETQMEKGDSKSCERRYFLLSNEKATHQDFATAVRGHWGIEAMHWTLDQTMREDDSRIRQGNSPRNFSATRKIAMNLIKDTELVFNGKVKKASMASKMRVAGWDTDFMLKVLFGKKT